MILKTLHLKNFRKFKDTVIEFPNGIIGVIGLNGAGKSTIFEAFAWTLYGPVAARTSADTIRREQAGNKDPCRVSLEFTFNNDAYFITREMTGKSLIPQATVTVNHKLLAQGADAVTRFIQNKLGMDFRSFYTSIFAKQKELNALSTMNPSDRRPLILKMLGIDQLDTIITDIRTDNREQKNHIQHLENQTYDKQGYKKTSIYEKELQHLQKQQEKIQQIKQQFENEISTLTKQQIQINDKTKHQKTQYEHLLGEKDSLENLKTKIDHRAQLKTQLKTLQQSIQQRTQQITTLQQEYQKIKHSANELTITQKQNQILINQNEKLIKQTEHVQTQITQIKQEIAKLNTKKTNINTLGPNAHCPTCKRLLGSQHTSLLIHFREEIKNHEDKLITLQKEQTNLKNQQNRITRQKDALNKKIIYLTEQRLKTEKLLTKIQSITNEIKREEQKQKSLNKEYQLLQKITFNTTLFKKIHIQIKKTYETYQKVLTEQITLHQKRENRRIKLETIKGQQQLIQQNIIMKKEQIKEQQQLLRKLENEKKQQQQLQILQEVMTGFRTHIISQIRPTLTQYASMLFHQLTDGKYSAVELDENYTLMIIDNGQTHSINRFSGGEEDLANLCIRLAISEVIAERAGSNFQFIILDEIFGSQDLYRRQNIINTLNRFSTKFRQIFLITHIEEIKYEMEHTLTVLEDENGISSIKLD
jgi:exonuclease SbcC